MKNRKGNNKILVIILIVIVFVLAYFLFFRKVNKTAYEIKEEEMLNKAIDYVTNSNLTISKEIYIDARKLNIILDNDCSITSGVFYDGKSYTPYLVCHDYASKINTENENVKDYLTLIGNEVLVLPKGMNYVEPGYVSNGVVDIIGAIGTEEGVYNLYYSTKNSNYFAKRKVVIVDSEEIKALYPEISIIGNEIEYIVEGIPYVEKGYIAQDQKDGLRYRILYLDRYYNNTRNRNNLYK